MKETRKCPKCGGTDIIIVNGYTGPHGAGNNIMTGATVYSAVPVDRYICYKCGYSEEWIDRSELGKLLTTHTAHR